jgi:Flp pilus assembly protein TadD
LTLRQRLELFVPVCQAIQHAHQKGIIHRDIKPSNVLVALYDGRPVPKVIDFGVAKATVQPLTDKSLVTGFGSVLGTLEYMSPEQAELNQLDIDTRSDVYSLGVLLYELLTGTTPLERKRLKDTSPLETLRLIREEEPPRPSTRLRTTEQLPSIAANRGVEPNKLSRLVRGELDWIVMKAVEKDRDRRYETASAFAADVQRYLDDEPVQACPPSPLYRLRKFVRRHKAGLGVAAGVLMLLVFGFSNALWWVRKQTGAETEARAALQEAARWQQEEKWSEALSAVRRAQGVIGGFGVDAALQRQIEQRGKDVEMAQRLEVARLQNTAVKDEHFDDEACVTAYADAFQWYGVDVEHLDPAEAGERIRAQSIQRQLVTALDYWAYRLARLKDRDRVKQLVAIARAADPDPWRDRLRDVLEGKDPNAVKELVASVQSDELPTATAVILARLTRETPEAERVANLLRQLQRRHPNGFWVNHDLAYCLQHLRPPRLEEAIRFYTAAIVLQHQSPGAHNNLGFALHEKGQVDEAIDEYREAIRLKKDYAEPHNNLGLALARKGQLDEAIAEYREAIRLKKDYVEAHYNLGLCLVEQGQFSQAVQELRRSHVLGSKKRRWPYPSAQWVRNCERLVELGDKVPAILNGEKQPADSAERLALAQLCQLPCKKRCAAAVRFYSEAFDEEPKLPDDLNAQHRYDAACAAALAGCGQGKDADQLDSKERARLRQQALDWLRADLKAYQQLMEKSAGKAGPVIAQRMQHWLGETDFAGLRGEEALAKLPEAERQAWHKLWQEVEELRRSAAATTKSPNQPQGKEGWPRPTGPSAIGRCRGCSGSRQSAC